MVCQSGFQMEKIWSQIHLSSGDMYYMHMNRRKCLQQNRGAYLCANYYLMSRVSIQVNIPVSQPFANLYMNKCTYDIPYSHPCRLKCAICKKEIRKKKEEKK